MPKFMPLPARSDLLREIRYEPETGLFWWVRPWHSRVMEKPAGCKIYRADGEAGAIQISIWRQRYLAHRLAWRIAMDEDPVSMTVDHIDRNPFNNRIDNLRLADYCLQTRNQRSRGLSLHKGVCFNKGMGMWLARGWKDGKRICLGYFATEEEAAAVAAPHYIP